MLLLLLLLCAPSSNCHAVSSPASSLPSSPPPSSSPLLYLTSLSAFSRTMSHLPPYSAPLTIVARVHSTSPHLLPTHAHAPPPPPPPAPAAPPPIQSRWCVAPHHAFLSTFPTSLSSPLSVSPVPSFEPPTLPTDALPLLPSPLPLCSLLQPLTQHPLCRCPHPSQSQPSPSPSFLYIIFLARLFTNSSLPSPPSVSFCRHPAPAPQLTFPPLAEPCSLVPSFADSTMASHHCPQLRPPCSHPQSTLTSSASAA